MAALTLKNVGRVEQYAETLTFVGVGAAALQMATACITTTAIAYAALACLAGEGVYLASQQAIYSTFSQAPEQWVRVGCFALGCLAAAYTGTTFSQFVMPFGQSLLLTLLSTTGGVGLRWISEKLLS